MPGLMMDQEVPQEQTIPQEGAQSPGGAGSLEQLKQTAESKVPEQFMDAYQRVVLAGKKIMYSDETHDLVKQALQEGADPANVGKGVAQLMGILSKESRNTIPEQVLMPAALTILADALDYVGQTTGQEIGPKEIDGATQGFASAFLKLSGVSQDTVSNMMNKTQELMADPTHRAAIEKNFAGNQDMMALFSQGE